jgi:hypothetical protein
VRPGLYFESRPAAAAWDAPVEFTTGMPILPALDGVIGVSHGRFHPHAIPVAGLVWTPGARVRIEAVYPEPAVSVTFSPTLTLRAGGELLGGGFRTDAPGHPVVEFSSYRAGTALTWKWRAGQSLTLGGGVEILRRFDFFRRGFRADDNGAHYGRLSAEFSR